MKKVLFITAYPPSEMAAAEKNTKIMLRDLAKDYEVDVVYFKYRNIQEYEYKPDVPRVKVIKVVAHSEKRRIINILRCPLYHPIFTVRFNSDVYNYLSKTINEVDYSAIIFDHSQTFIYAKKLRYEGPKILLSHDVEAQRYERTSNKLMAKFCRYSEGIFMKVKGVNIFTFCQKDVDLIKEYYGVDANLCLDYIDERITENSPKTVTHDFVLFGNWVRPDNYEGALWMLNGIGQYLSKPININIIGKNFPQEKLIVSDKVKVNNMGFVDNPYPIIAESKAMLCPLLFGAGIKVKVIESLASGTPVIGTDIAFEGFSDKYKDFMLLCKEVQDFAKEIEKVNFSLDERMSFKKMFVNDYTSLTIPKWLHCWFAEHN